MFGVGAVCDCACSMPDLLKTLPYGHDVSSESCAGCASMVSADAHLEMDIVALVGEWIRACRSI